MPVAGPYFTVIIYSCNCWAIRGIGDGICHIVSQLKAFLYSFKSWHSLDCSRPLLSFPQPPAIQSNPCAALLVARHVGVEIICARQHTTVTLAGMPTATKSPADNDRQDRSATESPKDLCLLTALGSDWGEGGFPPARVCNSPPNSFMGEDRARVEIHVEYFCLHSSEEDDSELGRLSRFPSISFTSNYLCFQSKLGERERERDTVPSYPPLSFQISLRSASYALLSGHPLTKICLVGTGDGTFSNPHAGFEDSDPLPSFAVSE